MNTGDTLLFDNRITGEYQFVSIQKAAVFLDKSQNAIRIMVCRGKLRAYKDGSRLEFTHQDLRNALCIRGAKL